MSEMDPPPVPRNPVGWIVLALLFAFLILSTVGGAPSDKPAARIARYTLQLKTAMSAYAAGDNPMGRLLNEDGPEEGLLKLERKTAVRHRAESIEAAVWATVRKQLGEGVADDDLAPLRKDPTNRVYAEAYRPAARTKTEASRLADALDERARSKVASPAVAGAVAETAANVVRREAGLPTRKAPPIPRAVGGLIAFLILASGLAWTSTALLGLSGLLKSQGPATEAPTRAVADALALRAAILMAAFFGLQFTAALAVRAGLDGRAGTGLAYAAMLVVVPLVLRRGPSMAEVGLHGRAFARDVGLGLWAFLLEIPVTLTLTVLSATLLHNLPAPEHPATTALSSAPDLLTIAVTFFGGVVAAPFWEETMFRGLLFPALRRYGGPVVAALVSSFLFASIHPQGPVLWAPLATIALFSCVLAQTTRSLVPSITMHFAHNAVLMVLTVWMGR